MLRRVLPLVLATVAAGCGSSEAPRTGTGDAEVRAAVTRYYAAYARSDGEAACALMTPAAQAAYAREAGAIADGIPCTELIESYGGQLAGAAPKVTAIEVDGDTATAIADFEEPQPDQRITLARSGGAWRITSSTDA